VSGRTQGRGGSMRTRDILSYTTEFFGKMTQENEWILRWKTIRWGAVPSMRAVSLRTQNGIHDVSLIAGDNSGYALSFNRLVRQYTGRQLQK
jgi:hypothetical protein